MRAVVTRVKSASVEIEGKINASVKRKKTYRAKMQCFKTFEAQIKNALEVCAEVEG